MKEQEHRKEIVANLRSLKPEELHRKKTEVGEQLFWLSFKQQTDQPNRSTQIRKSRRTLARIKTIQTEKEKKS